MKRILSILIAVFSTANIFAQAPEKLSYQTVIRDSSNVLVTNQQVGTQISILQGSVTGQAVYIETHTGVTNINGLLSLEIGGGTVISPGTFAGIDWSNGPYFAKVESDPAGGTTYSISGTSELLSVPYALYAKTAESANETDPIFMSSIAAGITASDTANWNNDMVNDADADSTNELQSISIDTNNVLSISGGNSVVIPADTSIWGKNGDSIFYNSGNVGIGTISPKASLDVHGDFVRSIAYNTANGPPDGRDVGYINGRTLAFVKKYDSTAIRIAYTDNLRVLKLPGNVGSACQWEIRVDSASCPDQELVYKYWVSVAGENTHRSRSVIGYCKGLGKGQHTIQVEVGPVSGVPLGDCHTGYESSTWVIEAEEVR